MPLKIKLDKDSDLYKLYSKKIWWIYQFLDRKLYSIFLAASSQPEGNVEYLTGLDTLQKELIPSCCLSTLKYTCGFHLLSNTPLS